MPEGGNYIYSSCETFNEEMEIDVKRLWHWLKRFSINSCGFSLDNEGSHASRNAIMLRPCVRRRYYLAIEQTDPNCIVPIHTEARDWFKERFRMIEEVCLYKFQIY